jgi:CheY-like chemotaxis protein
MTTINPTPVDDTTYSPLRQHNLEQATLLVVEDQDDLWAIVKVCLTKSFPHVSIHRCANRRETIAYLTDQITNGAPLPKLILQDLYLPQKEAGLSLVTDIRMLLANQQQIPIIVMSSSIAEDDVRRAYELGASFYIVKPLALNGWLSLTQSLHQFWWEHGVLPLTRKAATVE